MATFLDNLPPGLLTSTSGNGFALVGAFAAGSAYFHFTKDATGAAAVATGAASSILLTFPQRGAKPATPAATQAAEMSIEQAIDVIASKVAEGEKAKAAIVAVTAPKQSAGSP